METVKRTINLPSCRVNKEVLEAVCKFLKQEQQDMKEGEYEARLSIEIDTKHENFEFNSYDEFLSKDTPRELKRISISVSQYQSNQRITIYLGFETWHTSEISVSGNKSVWVKGVATELIDIFGDRPTKHSLVHDKKTSIPISLMCSIVSGFIFSMILSMGDNINILTKLQNGDFNLWYVGIIGISTMGVYWQLLQWLFPVVEFEGIGRQQRIRKKVIGAIVFLLAMLSVITSLI